MTEEEVEQIYDYLLENYRYENGDLIAIKNTQGQRSGKRIALGLMQTPEEAHAAYLKSKKEYNNECH